MTPPDIAIRPATAADVSAIAALHVAVWHDTYRHLAPAEAVRVLDEAHRLRQWTAVLASVSGITIVAEHDGRLIGIGRLASTAELIFAGRIEIKHLYVDRRWNGRGVGRNVFLRLANEAMNRGHQAMALGVIDSNDAAIRFYEKMGGKRIGHYRDPGPTWRSENLIYAWDDLTAWLNSRGG